MSDDPLREMLIRHEGKRLFPYDDKTGARFESGDTLIGQMTIGVGRNISQVGITNDEAMFLLTNDIERCHIDLTKALPWWNKMDECRRAVMISLCFNLGINKLLSFKTTLGLIESGKYGEAADRLLTLPWAQQVGKRATELTDMLRSGKWNVNY